MEKNHKPSECEHHLGWIKTDGWQSQERGCTPRAIITCSGCGRGWTPEQAPGLLIELLRRDMEKLQIAQKNLENNLNAVVHTMKTDLRPDPRVEFIKDVFASLRLRMKECVVNQRDMKLSEVTIYESLLSRIEGS